MPEVEGIFKIPAANMSTLRDKLAKLAKRGKRLGTGAVTLTVLREYTEKTGVDNNGYDIFRDFTDVRVSGKAPIVAGYTFVATLQWLDGVVIVRSVPGITTDAELVRFRSATQLCDHCHTSRYRLDTFIVRKDDGTYLQVGRNCLHDFLGHDAPEDIASYLQYVSNCMDTARSEEYSGGGRREDDRYAIELIVAYAAAFTRRLGFVSKSKAYEMNRDSTAGCIMSELAPDGTHGTTEDKTTGPGCYKDRYDCGYVKLGGHVHIIPEDEDVATAALAWIQDNVPDEKTSDYMYNLYTIANMATVTRREIGILASLPAAYHRWLTRDEERKKVASTRLNEWIGTVGKREKFKLKCVTCTACETDYGVSYLHIFVDSAGRTLKWFSSSVELEPEKYYDVTGTVKAHETYRDLRQTALTRCKCVEVAE